MVLATMIRLSVSALLIAAAVLATAGAARAVDIVDIRFGERPGGARIVIETSQPVAFDAFTLADYGDRLVVSLPQAGWSIEALPHQAGVGHGLVGPFRFDPSAQASRMVFFLEAPAVIENSFSLPPNGGGHRLVIDLARTDRAAFVAASGFPQTRDMTRLVADVAGAPATPPRCEQVRVVIDPGHGGSDPGALGRFGGAHESAVNLAAALQLRDILEETGRYEVVMTRERDVFLSLEERVEIAQRVEADLFISLHADASASSSAVRGAAVYTLSDDAVGRARQRAIRDGDWFLSDTTRPQPVNNLLLEMSLREKRNQSHVFADTLLTHAADAGPLLHGEPRQRGFFVLLDSQVPAVLFEMGFLTNREDARMLNDPAGRGRLMRRAALAIDQYFESCGGGAARHTLTASADASNRALRP